TFDPHVAGITKAGEQTREQPCHLAVRERPQLAVSTDDPTEDKPWGTAEVAASAAGDESVSAAQMLAVERTLATGIAPVYRRQRRLGLPADVSNDRRRVVDDRDTGAER